MNTGLLDATNLAWKLALVVTGRIVDNAAVERVLDSYTHERMPAIEAVFKNVRVQASMVFGRTQSDHGQAVTDFISEAFDQPAFNRLWAQRVTGFGDPTEPYRVALHGAHANDELVGTRMTHISEAHEHTVLQAAKENVFVLASVRHGTGPAHALNLPNNYQDQCKILDAALEPTGKKWEGVQAVLLRPDLRVAWVLRETSGTALHSDAPSDVLLWWFGDRNTVRRAINDRSALRLVVETAIRSTIF